MATIAGILDRALRTAAIPIDGVSIGVLADRATWRVDYQPTATLAHRTTATAIIAALAVDSGALAAEDQKLAQATVDNFGPVELAVLRVLLDEVNVLRTELNTLRAAVIPPLTPALPLRTETQFRNAVRVKAGL